MFIKFTVDYLAGMITGAGLLLFLLAISADAEMLSADSLKGLGVKFAAIAMILAGGGVKWRSQSRS